jgi:hypothetical protein
MKQGIAALHPSAFILLQPTPTQILGIHPQHPDPSSRHVQKAKHPPQTPLPFDGFSGVQASAAFLLARQQHIVSLLPPHPSSQQPPESPFKASRQPPKGFNASRQPERPYNAARHPERPLHVVGQPERPLNVVGQPERPFNAQTTRKAL